MGERAKVILNEYSAKNLLMRDTLDLDKFYTADLKLFVEVARKEIERLQEENLLLKASEPMSKLAEDYGYKAEIERLNNIINDLLNRQNEALRYIGNHLSLDSRYKHGNGDKELTIVRDILNKHIKELKGSE